MHLLDEVTKRRVIFITGKGGVGKTSVAAALARATAMRGKRVLLTEVAVPGDDYSPLAGLFGRHQLPRVEEVLCPGVHGVILLAQVGHELFAESAIGSGRVARAVMSSAAIQQFLRFTPSCRELGIYYHLLNLVKKKRENGNPLYDVVIVDMPSTGHALALTGLPQVLQSLFQRGPVAQAIRDGQACFNCPQTTKAFVVSLPEALPISEALDLLDGLERTEISVGGVILNRMSPNVFTNDELSALRGALDGRPILGGVSLHRLSESGRAVQRLRASTTLPVTTLHDVWSGDLVETLRQNMNGSAGESR